jgi:two-component system sensor histidine kinase AtoS
LSEEVVALKEEMKQGQTPSLISVAALLEEAQSAFPHLPPTINFVRQVASNLPDLRVVPNQIVNSLANLVVNSMQAMPDGGTITLSAGRVNSHIEIAVHDTGTGIPRNIRTRIFSLFFSTKGSSGFGLWSAHRNVVANGGTLKMETTVGKGSRFALILPAADTV